MSCDAVIDFLTRETGRFETEIYDRMWDRTPWIALTQKDSYPSEMGIVISNLTYERSAPTDAEPTWSAVAVNDGAEGGACLPPAQRISPGSTVRTYNLQRRVLEGPDICAEEIRFPFQAATQLDKVLNVLTDYATIEWEIKYRHAYLRNVKRRVVVGLNCSNVETTSGSWAAFCPGGQLSQSILNKYKMKLRRDGASRSAMGRDGGSAVLTLVTEAETSDKLIFDNADIRQDLRWGKPSELLAAIGVERSYRGFYHVIDDYAIHYSCSGGTFTEVAAFANQAATKGQKSEINSSWETAAYTTSYIFDPTVWTARIPTPIGASGGNTRFNGLNYTVGAGGVWSLKNIPDRVCNPDENIVFHRGHLACGEEPVHPERGIAFAHLRCDPSCNSVNSCN